MYNFIVDPYTNQKANINSKVGKQILKNYLRVILNGGGEQVVEVKLGKLKIVKSDIGELDKLTQGVYFFTDKQHPKKCLPSKFTEGTALKLRKEILEGTQFKICIDAIGRLCQFKNNSLLVKEFETINKNILTLTVQQVDDSYATDFSAVLIGPDTSSAPFHLTVKMSDETVQIFEQVVSSGITEKVPEGWTNEAQAKGVAGRAVPTQVQPSQ